MKKIEDEMFKVISGKAPELVSHFKNHDQTNPQVGLGAISEEMEDLDEELDEEISDAQDDFDEETSDYEDEDSSKRKNLDNELDNDNMEDSDQDVMEISDVQVKAPKLVKCEEDDDFVNMFDKMLNEETKSSKNVSSGQVDVVAPVHLRQNKKNYGTILVIQIFRHFRPILDSVVILDFITYHKRFRQC